MAGKIKILSAGAVKPGLVPALATFQRETGNDIAIEFATAPAIRQRLSTGEAPDIVIAPPEVLDELAQTSKAAADCVTLGRIGVGVMVRDGAPLPRIATIEEFKQSLLNSQSIVFNQASTGLYIESLFARLGIAEQIESKITRYADFAAVRDHVSNGQGNEIAFGATTVIVENAGNGLRFVCPLPAELQNHTTYTAALTEQAGEPAHALLRYFATPAAKAIFNAAGIE